MARKEIEIIEIKSTAPSIYLLYLSERNFSTRIANIPVRKNFCIVEDKNTWMIRFGVEMHYLFYNCLSSVPVNEHNTTGIEI